MTSSKRTMSTLHLIAVYEAFKGLLALLLLVGLFSLIHHDLRRIAFNMIGRYGLVEHPHYAAMLEHGADVLSDTNKGLIMGLGFAYAALRFAEAYGLWHDWAWGEWIGALSGGLYLPFEVMHMIRSPHWSSVLVFVFNLLMVVYLSARLYTRRKA